MSTIFSGLGVIQKTGEYNAANADGGDRKEIPASLEGRDARLLVKISPPILTSDNIQDASIMFRLFDTKTNETIKFVSLFLFISKDGKQLISPDLYHSPQGILKLKIQPSPGETVIYANKEPHLDAWEADPGGVINLKGPLLLEGGLYRIHVEVFGIDSPLNIFPDDKVPKFDVYLSVGDIYHDEIQYDSKNYNVTIVSYYDNVKDFSFDPERKEFAWSMPFNYNLTRIQKEGDIFIHEEVRIPWSLAEITNQTFYKGMVDGILLLPSSLAKDPYSSESHLYIHFLINKDLIQQIVKESPQIDKQGTMKFSLSPANAGEVQTSTSINFDRGNLVVSLSWNPGQLSAKTPTELVLTFYDQVSGERVSGNVKYDFFVYATSGMPERIPIIRMENNIALSGTDALANIVFPENDIYDLEIDVKEISTPSSSGDTSRVGRALGAVVVPEFGSVISVVVAVSLLGTLMAGNHLLRKSPSQSISVS